MSTNKKKITEQLNIARELCVEIMWYVTEVHSDDRMLDVSMASLSRQLGEIGKSVNK